MNITIIEKPEWVSYDEIHELLWRANEENRKEGFHLRTAEFSGDELKKRIGKNGKCFVALDGNKLVGTLSVRFIDIKGWYYKGTIPDYVLAGVLPEYQGMHINTMLTEKVFEYVQNGGYTVIELDTASNNAHAISVYKHQGFECVDYIYRPRLDHESVVMVKWFEKRKYNAFFVWIRFTIRKIKVKVKRYIREF